MRHKLAKWLASSPAERRLLLEAWLLLAGVGAGLRFLPLRRLQDLLLRSNRLRRLPSGDPERMARLVGIASRHQIWEVRCLERSLVLQALLARCGTCPDLRIGVRREGDTLYAHAWIEVEGRPVGEARDIAGSFRPFPGAFSA